MKKRDLFGEIPTAGGAFFTTISRAAEVLSFIPVPNMLTGAWAGWVGLGLIVAGGITLYGMGYYYRPILYDPNNREINLWEKPLKQFLVASGIGIGLALIIILAFFTLSQKNEDHKANQTTSPPIKIIKHALVEKAVNDLTYVDIYFRSEIEMKVRHNYIVALVPFIPDHIDRMKETEDKLWAVVNAIPDKKLIEQTIPPSTENTATFISAGPIKDDLKDFESGKDVIYYLGWTKYSANGISGKIKDCGFYKSDNINITHLCLKSLSD